MENAGRFRQADPSRLSFCGREMKIKCRPWSDWSEMQSGPCKDWLFDPSLAAQKHADDPTWRLTKIGCKPATFFFVCCVISLKFKSCVRLESGNDDDELSLVNRRHCERLDYFLSESFIFRCCTCDPRPSILINMSVRFVTSNLNARGIIIIKGTLAVISNSLKRC